MPILSVGLGLNCTSGVENLCQQVVPGGGENLLAEAACKCNEGLCSQQRGKTCSLLRKEMQHVGKNKKKGLKFDVFKSTER